jgi:hypothetical protein
VLLGTSLLIDRYQYRSDTCKTVGTFLMKYAKAIATAERAEQILVVVRLTRFVRRQRWRHAVAQQSGLRLEFRVDMHVRRLRNHIVVAFGLESGAARGGRRSVPGYPPPLAAVRAICSRACMRMSSMHAPRRPPRAREREPRPTGE